MEVMAALPAENIPDGEPAGDNVAHEQYEAAILMVNFADIAALKAASHGKEVSELQTRLEVMETQKAELQSMLEEKDNKIAGLTMRVQDLGVIVEVLQNLARAPVKISLVGKAAIQERIRLLESEKSSLVMEISGRYSAIQRLKEDKNFFYEEKQEIMKKMKKKRNDLKCTKLEAERIQSQIIKEKKDLITLKSDLELAQLGLNSKTESLNDTNMVIKIKERKAERITTEVELLRETLQQCEQEEVEMLIETQHVEVGHAGEGNPEVEEMNEHQELPGHHFHLQN